MSTIFKSQLREILIQTSLWFLGITVILFQKKKQTRFVLWLLCERQFNHFNIFFPGGLNPCELNPCGDASCTAEDKVALCHGESQNTEFFFI